MAKAEWQHMGVTEHRAGQDRDSVTGICPLPEPPPHNHFRTPVVSANSHAQRWSLMTALQYLFDHNCNSLIQGLISFTRTPNSLKFTWPCNQYWLGGRGPERVSLPNPETKQCENTASAAGCHFRLFPLSKHAVPGLNCAVLGKCEANKFIYISLQS